MEKIEIDDLYASRWNDPWNKYIDVDIVLSNGKTETIARGIKTFTDDYEENYNIALSVANALGYYLSGELN